MALIEAQAAFVSIALISLFAHALVDIYIARPDVSKEDKTIFGALQNLLMVAFVGFYFAFLTSAFVTNIGPP